MFEKLFDDYFDSMDDCVDISELNEKDCFDFERDIYRACNDHDDPDFIARTLASLTIEIQSVGYDVVVDERGYVFKYMGSELAVCTSPTHLVFVMTCEMYNKFSGLKPILKRKGIDLRKLPFNEKGELKQPVPGLPLFIGDFIYDFNVNDKYQSLDEPEKGFVDDERVELLLSSSREWRKRTAGGGRHSKRMVLFPTGVSTYEKFMGIENQIVIHPGSGTRRSLSLKALMRNNRVVPVDPVLDGVAIADYLKAEHPNYTAMVSDACVYDGGGLSVMTNNLVSEMHDAVINDPKYLGDVLVYKFYCCNEKEIPMNLRNLKGFVQHPGRPHNLEIIVKIDESGEPISELFKWKRAVSYNANKLRNFCEFVKAILYVPYNFIDYELQYGVNFQIKPPFVLKTYRDVNVFITLDDCIDLENAVDFGIDFRSFDGMPISEVIKILKSCGLTFGQVKQALGYYLRIGMNFEDDGYLVLRDITF